VVGSALSRAGRAPAAGAAPQTGISFVQLNDICMPQDFPAHAHTFRLSRHRVHMIADGAIVDAWRAAGLIGAVFTTPKPPTEVDMAAHLSFANYPYWTRKGLSS
jgi:hypothetical protein